METEMRGVEHALEKVCQGLDHPVGQSLIKSFGSTAFWDRRLCW